MDEQDIETYLNGGEYAGVNAGHYDFCCPLKFVEINNFVQNAGLYSDVEVVRGTDEGMEILFNTYGTYINRIWPELSLSDRDALQITINKMASRLVEEFDKDNLKEVLPKVEKFLTDVMDVDMQEHMDKKAFLERTNEMEMQ